MVTAKLIDSWPGPSARISIGSSTTIQSVLSRTSSPSTASTPAGAASPGEAGSVSQPAIGRLEVGLGFIIGSRQVPSGRKSGRRRRGSERRPGEACHRPRGGDGRTPWRARRGPTSCRISCQRKSVHSPPSASPLNGAPGPNRRWKYAHNESVWEHPKWSSRNHLTIAISKKSRLSRASDVPSSAARYRPAEGPNAPR